MRGRALGFTMSGIASFWTTLGSASLIILTAEQLKCNHVEETGACAGHSCTTPVGGRPAVAHASSVCLCEMHAAFKPMLTAQRTKAGASFECAVENSMPGGTSHCRPVHSTVCTDSVACGADRSKKGCVSEPPAHDLQPILPP